MMLNCIQPTTVPVQPYLGDDGEGDEGDGTRGLFVGVRCEKYGYCR